MTCVKVSYPQPDGKTKHMKSFYVASMCFKLIVPQKHFPNKEQYHIYIGVPS